MIVALSDPVLVVLVGAFVTVFTTIASLLSPWLLSRIVQVTNTRLTQIHTLVNSDKTAIMMAELSSVRREQVMMQELIALREAAGQKPGIGTIKALEATQLRIEELEAAVADRLKQTAMAEEQLKLDQNKIVGITHV